MKVPAGSEVSKVKVSAGSEVRRRVPSTGSGRFRGSK